MSENQNRRISERSEYDKMTTEELEELLRLDAEAPEEQESDTETLLYVMEVLTNRKKHESHTENTAQKAYESFKKHYLPEVEEHAIESEEIILPRAKPLRCLRGLSVAAAVVIVILLGSVTAKAFGYDIWETVVKWTQETFHFGDGGQNDDGPDINNNLPYASIQEALQTGNIDAPLVPTWIPEGYQLSDITIQESPMQDVYNAIYSNGENAIRITVRNHLNSAPQYIEQSDDFAEIYEVNGIEYFLFSNNERVSAAWINSSYECSILGELTIEELKLMIDSIEKG